MRKLLICFVLLLIPSLASAQQGYAGLQFGAGFVSAGSVGGVSVPVSAHVGFGVSPMIDVRADLSYFVTGGGVQIGANGLGKFEIDSGSPITAYGGGGLRILMGGSSAAFGIGGLGGAEYMVTEQVGVFGEGGLDMYFAGFVTNFKLGAGANFHF